MNISSINKKLKKTFGGKFSASKENGSIFVRGKSSDWGEIVAACQAAAKKFSTTHIVNDIVYTGEQPARRVCRLSRMISSRAEHPMCLLSAAAFQVLR